MAKQEIEAGQLKRVLPDVFNEKIPYYLAYRKKADIPRREKALINFMFDKFG
jgi:DNA-binding transcriptional LysR family regulator